MTPEKFWEQDQTEIVVKEMPLKGSKIVITRCQMMDSESFFVNVRQEKCLIKGLVLRRKFAGREEAVDAEIKALSSNQIEIKYRFSPDAYFDKSVFTERAHSCCRFL